MEDLEKLTKIIKEYREAHRRGHKDSTDSESEHYHKGAFHTATHILAHVKKLNENII